MRYHPCYSAILTKSTVEGALGQWQPVSFTGAVSSQKITEECEGLLSTVGNRVSSI